MSKDQKNSSGWISMAVMIGAGLVLGLVVKTYVLQMFYIPSESMEPTLEVGDQIVAWKLNTEPDRGQIAVFEDPGGWLPFEDEHIIKRVIGLPGDRVSSEGNGAPIVVNGIEVTEGYVSDEPSTSSFDVVVDEGMLWVLGDNRENSSDSRYQSTNGGQVPLENIVGTVSIKAWKGFEWLKLEQEVFERVPKGE